jgi:predicted GNAT family acetyltransferase
MPVDVIHRPELQRFETVVDGRLALCAYRLEGALLVLHHTEVPSALQGQGLAAALVAAALAWARSRGLKVRPSCSYVAAYMRRHPEAQDLLEQQHP